ncbi:hypothetical protein CL176_10075 [Suicoccus acidiformans]|uniref:Serine protease n=1 Tax=Suicoccus acidiformans TaxID=2036206 RepID=A0A347WMK7_9LACT|nr:serine protease [Suicoccus acidiformans]AXY26314.1 hypothetical protein CL176_10075 [Suicoccus acidiformans]
MDKILFISLVTYLVLSLSISPDTTASVHAATEQTTDQRKEITKDDQIYIQNIALVQEAGKDKDFGTGVRLNQDTILTNKHVVDAIDEQKLIVKLRDTSGEFQDYKVTEIHAAPEVHQDLALLKIEATAESNTEANTETFPLTSANSIKALKADDKVHIVGYPGDKDYGSLWRSDGDVHEVDAENGVIVFTAQIGGGNSGSPLFNEAGEIIGLVNETSDDPNDPLAFGFVFTDSLYQFIQKHL